MRCKAELNRIETWMRRTDRPEATKTAKLLVSLKHYVGPVRPLKLRKEIGDDFAIGHQADRPAGTGQILQLRVNA